MRGMNITQSRRVRERSHTDDVSPSMTDMKANTTPIIPKVALITKLSTIRIRNDAISSSRRIATENNMS